MGKFQIFKSSVNGQFNYRLRAGNNEPILSGESYYSKQSCENGISAVKQNCALDSRYSKTDSPFNYRFNLTAANGEIIGRSEGYTTAASRDNGIAAIKREAPSSPTEDLT